MKIVSASGVCCISSEPFFASSICTHKKSIVWNLNVYFSFFFCSLPIAEVSCTGQNWFHFVISSDCRSGSVDSSHLGHCSLDTWKWKNNFDLFYRLTGYQSVHLQTLLCSYLYSPCLEVIPMLKGRHAVQQIVFHDHLKWKFGFSD